MSNQFRKNNKDSKYYFQHDNRGSRKVGYKQNMPIQISNFTRGRKFLRGDRDEDDVEMHAPGVKKYSAHRHNPYNSGKGRKGQHQIRKLTESSAGWYKVVLCYGKKYDRQDLLKRLQLNIQPMTLIPIGIANEDADVTFYVDDHKVANILFNLSLKLELKDKWKLQIKVFPKVPYVELQPDTNETIKLRMSSRYDVATNTLNLSRFHADSEFIQNNLLLPLTRQNITLVVFQIIVENVPHLHTLDLSDNKIYLTEHFSLLKNKLTNLKVLNLSKNKIKEVSALKVLDGMELEELVLDNNPVCDSYPETTRYIRDVRKLFPKLLRLDGVVLPAPVSIAVEEKQQKLPPSQHTYMCDFQYQEIVKRFLHQYYSIYDNQTSRDGLIEAYYEDAQFSLSAYTSQTGGGGRLGTYIQRSRNLLKVNNMEKRCKLLLRGKQKIIEFLNTLPKTQHDPSSLAVDLILGNPGILIFTVAGIFQETEEGPKHNKKLYTRSFSRVFSIVPAGTGFNIVNEQLLITVPTDDQIHVAFAAAATNSVTAPSAGAAPLAAPSLAPLSSLVSPLQSLSMINKVPDTAGNEMVTALSLQTGMNMAWSEKCLTETGWIYEKAVNAFTEFSKCGSIPPEAFIK